MRVVVVGSGLMGSQIGCEYALGGHSVTFVARRPDVAAENVERAFALVAGFEVHPAEAIAAARRNVEIVPDGAGVPGDAALVVESVVEHFETKVEVLRRFAGELPNAILASNTSALSISALGEAAGAPERTLGTHYWNPPLLMPLVEVICGERTDSTVIERVTGTLRDLGKRPVVVAKDVPGFVWNRLQLALLREAVWIVENGVMSPEALDETVRDGLARRWRLTGPFETVALGGPDTFARVAGFLWPQLSSAAGVEDLRRWLTVPPDVLAKVREARDRGLVEELIHDRRGEGGSALRDRWRSNSPLE